MKNKTAFMAIALGLVLTSIGSGVTYAHFTSQTSQSNTVTMSAFKKFRIDSTVNSTKAIEEIKGNFASYTTNNTNNNLGGMKFELKAETEIGKEALGNDITIVFTANWAKRNTASWDNTTKTLNVYLQPGLPYNKNSLETLINKASIPNITKLSFNKLGGGSLISLSSNDKCSAQISGGVNSVQGTKESITLTLLNAPEVDGNFDIVLKNNNALNLTKTISVSKTDSIAAILDKISTAFLEVKDTYDISVNDTSITLTNKTISKDSNISIDLFVK